MNVCVSKNTNQKGSFNGLQTNVKFAFCTENLKEAHSHAVDEEHLLLDIRESPSE